MVWHAFHAGKPIAQYPTMQQRGVRAYNRSTSEIDKEAIKRENLRRADRNYRQRLRSDISQLKVS